MLDFGTVLFRFSPHSGVLFVPDFTCGWGESECAIHCVNTLGFNCEKSGEAVLFFGGRGPRIQEVEFVLQSENDTACETVADDLLLELCADPFGRAASQHAEVRVFNLLRAAVAGFLFEVRFVPDGG